MAGVCLLGVSGYLFDYGCVDGLQKAYVHAHCRGFVLGYENGICHLYIWYVQCDGFGALGAQGASTLYLFLWAWAFRSIVFILLIWLYITLVLFLFDPTLHPSHLFDL